ncbi:MAG: hypothetical protein P8Y60_06655 [Calditrichota bacterium]|jgi:hypothetical protein
MKFKIFKKANRKVDENEKMKFEMTDSAIQPVDLLSHRDEVDKSGIENTLTPERIAEIRERINENFYDREDILKIVAERILHSPELRNLIKSGRLDEIM